MKDNNNKNGSELDANAPDEELTAEDLGDLSVPSDVEPKQNIDAINKLLEGADDSAINTVAETMRADLTGESDPVACYRDLFLESEKMKQNLEYPYLRLAQSIEGYRKRTVGDISKFVLLTEMATATMQAYVNAKITIKARSVGQPVPDISYPDLKNEPVYVLIDNLLYKLGIYIPSSGLGEAMLAAGFGELAISSTAMASLSFNLYR